MKVLGILTVIRLKKEDTTINLYITRKMYSKYLRFNIITKIRNYFYFKTKKFKNLIKFIVNEISILT